MKVLIIILTLNFFNCAQVNGSENFNDATTNFNTPTVTNTPKNIFTTTDELEFNIENDAVNFQGDLTTAPDLDYATRNLDVDSHQDLLSDLLIASNKNDFEKLLQKATNGNTDSPNIFTTKESLAEIEPTIQSIDKNVREEAFTSTEKNHHTNNLFSMTFGTDNNSISHLPTKRSAQNNPEELMRSTQYSDFTGIDKKESENKKRHLIERQLNNGAKSQTANFGNLNFRNDNPSNQNWDNNKESGDAILTMAPSKILNNPGNKNFENGVLTMIPPSVTQNNNIMTTEPQANKNPMLGSRSAFVDYEEIEQPSPHSRTSFGERNDPIPQNIQMPIDQSSSHNVARILQNLEKKVENIANLVQKTCGHSANNEESLADPNLIGSLDKSSPSLNNRQLPTNPFSSRNSLPNKNDLEEDTQNLAFDSSEFDDLKPQTGDVVGDINQELLSELDEENTPAAKDKKLPNIFSRFGDNSQAHENTISDKESSKEVTEPEFPEKKVKFTKFKDLLPKHKPLFRNHHTPARAGHGFAKKNNFFHPLTGMKKPAGPNSAFVPNKERVGDTFGDFEEEIQKQINPLEDFLKNKLHIPTVDELLNLAKLRSAQDGNAPFKNLKSVLPNLDPKRPIVQPKALWNQGDSPVGASRKPLPSLLDGLNQRSHLNLFNKPLFKNRAAQDQQGELSNSIVSDGPSPDEGKASPSIPNIGQRFGGDNEPSDGILGSRGAQNPYTTLGKIVLPKNRPGSLLNPTDKVYFEGNGINLPLKVAKNSDGSLQLSVDADKLCPKCIGNGCNIDDVVGSSQLQKSTLLQKLTSRMAENINKPLVDPAELKSRLLEKTDDFMERRKNLFDANTNKLQSILQPSKNDVVGLKTPLLGQTQDKTKLLDLPQMKARMAERTQNFIDQNKNIFENKLQPLFPRASQVAKRSPKLLFNSPFLRRNSLQDTNLNPWGDFEDFEFSVDKDDRSVLGKNSDKKDHIKKRVAIVKDVLNWMKDIGKVRAR